MRISDWSSDVCSSDLSVVKLMLQRLPATALLVIASLVVAVIVGTLLGVLSARKPNGLLNHFVSIFSLAGYAAPVFWTGLMLVVLFAAYIPLFPVNGMADVAHPKQGLDRKSTSLNSSH